MVRQARLMKFLPTITRILSIGGTFFLKSKLKLVIDLLNLEPAVEAILEEYSQGDAA